MLRCELPNHLPPLDPAEFARRADSWTADFFTVVVDHVIPETSLYPDTTTMTALCDALEQRQLPDLHVLNRVVGWVLFQMQHHRKLTDAEQRVLAAAWRLSDSLHGPRYE